MFGARLCKTDVPPLKGFEAHMGYEPARVTATPLKAGAGANDADLSIRSIE
jgi:hypothetical protein